ncbi:hypothetical protein COY27_00485 [Candidatus Woesearchaeota archaeon CG_4_10_14_0_2_um_filter_33_13]|nr:MAG: hypothetical protein COY27_00485 [Candidatus Woesearchaeota archaeon CG_4_10_14_0_2_um_filter_33_13]
MTNNAWNESHVGTYSQYDNSELDVIHPVILRMVGEIKDRKVADYGCGEGKLVQELVEREAEVFGYDLSDSMISEAKKRIKDKAALKKIKSGVIPLPNNTLDAVVSNLVLMMCDSVEHIREIHQEINRVLKPGGILAYCITHPAFTDKTFTTYRNIFIGNRDYFQTAQQYQFVLRRKDGTEVTDESFLDYHYSLSTYLNLSPENGFNFRELCEVSVPGNSLPPYIVVKSTKAGF